MAIIVQFDEIIHYPFLNMNGSVSLTRCIYLENKLFQIHSYLDAAFLQLAFIK